MRAFAQKQKETQQAKTTNYMMYGASRVQVEPKLTVNTPEDMYEREADRVADQVMRMPGPQVQPAAADGGGCPECGKEQSGHEQFQIGPVEANSAGDITVPPVVHEVFSSLGQPLDPTTRGFMESRFGHDFSKVRVHTGPRADDAARAVQARAFTMGHDMVFGTDQYASHGTRERRLLAHELTHVLQQRPSVDSAAAPISGVPAVRQRAPALSVQCQKANPAQSAADDAAFWEWWKPVSGIEGSFKDWERRPENILYDRGGKTNYGVTIALYMKYAKSLGLPATEEGFKAMTPDQATGFGRMMWKASGASKVKNTGVALVLADWYWGGVDLRRFSALLKEKGRAATFKEGKPDDATIAFMNALSPSELVELMSDAKKAQYQKERETHPEQRTFTEGLLGRSEQRRAQAQPFVAAPESQPTRKPTTGMSLWDRGQRALEQARGVLETGEAAGPEEKKAAKEELWSVVSLIEQKQKAGFAHAEEEMELRNLKGQLLKKVGGLMGTGP
jgi:lysozyme family protein